jgi:hypothetical protein
MYPVKGQKGTYVAGDGITMFGAKLADADVTRSFSPEPGKSDWSSFAASVSGAEMRPEWGLEESTGLVGGQPVAIQSSRHDDDRPSQEVTIRKHGDGAMVDVRTRCMAVRFQIHKHGGKRMWDTPIGMGRRSSRGVSLPKGTALYWDDGSRAGETTAPVSMFLQPKGDKRCGLLYFDGDSDPNASLLRGRSGKPLKLCVHE